MMDVGSRSLVTALLITTLTTFHGCNGQPKVLNFSASVPVPRQGNDVTLLCETDGSSSTIEIKRLHPDKQLVMSRVREQSLSYKINSTTCDDIGTYVCVVDNIDRHTTEVAVIDCDPRPCQDDDVNRTIFVHVSQPVQFVLCVLAYPGIVDHAMFNNTSVRKEKQSNWTWDYEEGNFSTGHLRRLNIYVTRDQMVLEEYGLLNIRMFSSAGQRYYLDYNILLQSPGPPECPTDVSVIDERVDYVMLSWKPGLDGGYKQSFHVYFSNDNVTWYIRDLRNQETEVNITGLLENTNYYFRVVSSNMHRLDVDESSCNDTTSGTTSKSGSSCGETGNDDTAYALYIVLAVCAVSVSFTVILIILLYRQRVKIRRQDTRGEREYQWREESQNENVQDSGRCVSQDGLTYITVSHVQDKSKKKISRRKRKRKEEKIVYAALDYSQSGQVPTNSDDQRHGKMLTDQN